MNRYLSAVAMAMLALVTTFSFANHQNGHVDVQVFANELSPRAVQGQTVFNTLCAVCHGENASGTLAGPPLIHTIYNPNHHDNNSFSRAVTKGVQQHHWTYGNMPPLKGVGFSPSRCCTRYSVFASIAIARARWSTP